MAEEKAENFPLSKEKTAKGSRKLAREKVLQTLIASQISGTKWTAIFPHIFFRKFNFGDTEKKLSKKLLTYQEIYEIEADIPIKWKDEEILFGRKLVGESIKNKEYVEELIKRHAKNWDFDRIARIDRTLMIMAVVELIKFKEIPTKVSINEAIEIAKKYSTPKSGVFINGILDSLLVKLKGENLVYKSGKGLVNN